MEAVSRVKGVYVRLDGIWHEEPGQAMQQITDPALSDSLLAQILYPEIARRAGIEGKVTAIAQVDQEGKARDIALTDSIGSICDRQVVQALQFVDFRTAYLASRLPARVRVQVTFVHEGWHWDIVPL